MPHLIKQEKGRLLPLTSPIEGVVQPEAPAVGLVLRRQGRSPHPFGTRRSDRCIQQAR